MDEWWNCIMGDPYVVGSWIFEWYTPDQELRPNVWLAQIGIPPNPVPPVPYLISDASKGQTVRFRSFTGGSGPKYTPVNQDIPFNPGSLSKFVQTEEAEIDLRVLFKADSQVLLWAQLKGLPYLFNPLRGTGTLKVTNPAGEVRYLSAICISGFKLDESTLQEKSVEASLTFYANDPWWYSDWNVRNINIFDTLSGTLPILPVGTVLPGSYITRFNMINYGDVKNNAVFIVNGPFTNPILQNESINLVVSYNNALQFTQNGGVTTLIGNSLTVDCINKKATTIGIGPPPTAFVSRISNLTHNSCFFYILPGGIINYVTCTLTGIDANTSIDIISRSAYSTMF